ncbi:hypothetical protein [Sphingopyxis panaciterrae]
MNYPAIIILSALSLAFSACSSSSDFHPTDAEIAKLERLLDGHKCIGNLRDWRRSYVRSPIFTQEEVAAAKRENRLERLENFDKRMIEFALRRADGRVIKAGRVKPKQYGDFVPTDGCSEPDCVNGGYIVPRDELFLECAAAPAP